MSLSKSAIRPGPPTRMSRTQSTAHYRLLVWSGPWVFYVGSGLPRSSISPDSSCTGFAERMNVRSETPDLVQRRTRQSHRPKCGFTGRVYTREATKTGLKWPFMRGCVGKHEESGLEALVVVARVRSGFRAVFGERYAQLCLGLPSRGEVGTMEDPIPRLPDGCGS